MSLDKKKIKVVHVAQSAGGVERYLKMFIKYFNSELYEQYLIVSKDYSQSKAYFQSYNCKVHLIDMKREISPVKDFKAMVTIYKLLKDIDADIVYSHSSKAGALARIPAKLVRSFNIYNPHGWAFDMNISPKKKKLYLLIEKFYALFTDKIVAISKYEKLIAIDNKVINENRIVIIENAIDVEEVSVAKANNLLKDSWSSDSFIIGMVARLSEQKSPLTFVEVGIKLLNKIPEARFIMVGDGDQKQLVEQYLMQTNLLDKFLITGWVSNPNEYISLFDIALLTSKWEGFGLVIPEYMLQNKPVIASNVGGISNIIEHGYTGFLVDDLNVDDFVKYIVELYNNKSLNRKIVKNANDLVHNKYDFKRNVKEHIELFESLVLG